MAEPANVQPFSPASPSRQSSLWGLFLKDYFSLGCGPVTSVLGWGAGGAEVRSKIQPQGSWFLAPGSLLAVTQRVNTGSGTLIPAPEQKGTVRTTP